MIHGQLELYLFLLFDIIPFQIINEDDDIKCVKKILQNKFSFSFNWIDRNNIDIKIRKYLLLNV